MSEECVHLMRPASAQAISSLSQVEVQFLADKILEEISLLNQKSISKKKVMNMVIEELRKLSTIS